MHSQEGICDKQSAPSVSSISRVLRGSSKSLSGYRSGSDTDQSSDYHGRSKDHSIDGILGGKFFSFFQVFCQCLVNFHSPLYPCPRSMRDYELVTLVVSSICSAISVYDHEQDVRKIRKGWQVFSFQSIELVCQSHSCQTKVLVSPENLPSSLGLLSLFTCSLTQFRNASLTLTFIRFTCVCPSLSPRRWWHYDGERKFKVWRRKCALKI